MEGTKVRERRAGAGRNAQPVKWLQYEHEDLHSIPRTHTATKAGSSGRHTLITLARESDSLIAEVH